LSLLTGFAGSSGNFDGPAATAQLFYPTGVVADGVGNVYIATGLGVIKKVDSAGIVSTLAGRPGALGITDGQGAAARFQSVSAMAADDAGNLHVLDDRQVVRRITADRQVTTLATLSGDVSGMARSPVTGMIYAIFSDGGIVEIRPDGHVTVPSWPMPWMLPPGNSFNADVALDASDNLYVVAPSGVYRLPPDRSTAVPLFALQLAPYAYQWKIAVHPSGTRLYIANESNVYGWSNGSGPVLLAGPGTTGSLSVGARDGAGSQALFSWIEGVTTDRVGDLLVADGHNNAIRRVSTAGDVTTVVGRLPVIGVVNGSPGTARFSNINGLAAAADGSLWVADAELSGSSGLIRRVQADGTVTTLLGQAGGMTTQPRIEWPVGIAVGSLSGELYFEDNDECRLFKYSPVLGLRILAQCQWPDASLRNLNGLALRGQNVYVASGNKIQRLSKNGGTAAVFAGSADAGFQDGLASDARFNELRDMVFDAAGNLFVADRGNAVIRKITPDGQVSTFAGMPGERGSVDGQGTNARFVMPGALAIDSVGNLYVGDTADFTVRKITPGGSVQTVAGVSGLGRFVPGAAPGGLEPVSGLAIHGDKLYITMPQGIAVLQPRP
ncbi:MAG TPA: hypothetical protein VFL86_10320, partial [Burkholderiaceae bacterium]|nr:hypothetical protein [Burkholderiaceae bacterium]